MDRILDLGEISRPLLLFGGPYGNLEATAALFAEAARLGIAPAQMICTGDVVAYCADPAACTDMLRQADIAVVQGNCEEQLGQDASDCGCGFAEGTVCDRLSQAWYEYCSRQLDASAKAWMAALPRQIRFRMGGRRFAVVHGAASSINKFVFASTPAEVKLREFALTGTDAIVAGHSGLPFAERVGERLWLNAGVIGMPANDGTPRGWYALLQPRREGVAIDIRPLDYDHASAAAKMQEAGLPAEYRRALPSGLWDNMEILPAAERAMRGQPLTAQSLEWVREPA